MQGMRRRAQAGGRVHRRANSIHPSQSQGVLCMRMPTHVHKFKLRLGPARGPSPRREHSQVAVTDDGDDNIITRSHTNTQSISDGARACVTGYLRSSATFFAAAAAADEAQRRRIRIRRTHAQPQQR